MAATTLKNYPFTPIGSGGVRKFSFICVPKILFEDEELRKLLPEEKILYALMLDRKKRSVKNKWFGNKGRAYIKLTQEEATKRLHCGKSKVAQMYRNLEKYGLIEREKTGLRRPDRIYVKDVTDPEKPTFLRAPKLMFSNACLNTLSIEAMLLYVLMLDRAELSIRSEWVDEYGDCYIFFSVEDVMKALGCSKGKASKLLRELDQNGIGLIRREVQGVGSPTKIYVNDFSSIEEADSADNFDSVLQNTLHQNDQYNGEFVLYDSKNDSASRVQISGVIGPKNNPIHAQKTTPNKKENNKTEFNKTSGLPEAMNDNNKLKSIHWPPEIERGAAQAQSRADGEASSQLAGCSRPSQPEFGQPANEMTEPEDSQGSFGMTRRERFPADTCEKAPAFTWDVPESAQEPVYGRFSVSGSLGKPALEGALGTSQSHPAQMSWADFLEEPEEWWFAEVAFQEDMRALCGCPVDYVNDGSEDFSGYWDDREYAKSFDGFDIPGECAQEDDPRPVSWLSESSGVMEMVDLEDWVPSEEPSCENEVPYGAFELDAGEKLHSDAAPVVQVPDSDEAQGEVSLGELVARFWRSRQELADSEESCLPEDDLDDLVIPELEDDDYDDYDLLVYPTNWSHPASEYTCAETETAPDEAPAADEGRPAAAPSCASDLGQPAHAEPAAVECPVIFLPRLRRRSGRVRHPSAKQAIPSWKSIVAQALALAGYAAGKHAWSRAFGWNQGFAGAIMGRSMPAPG